jgi:hypothetical protein
MGEGFKPTHHDLLSGQQRHWLDDRPQYAAQN